MNSSCVLLALSLVAWAPSASAAVSATSSSAGSEAPTAVDRVRLEVDHSALLDQQKAAAADKSGFFVREDTERVLRERHQVEVQDDGTLPSILVKLAWKDYENSVYIIEVATRRPGEAPKVVESFEATCINNSALVDAVLEKIPAALEQLAEPKKDGGSEPNPGDPKTDPKDPPVVEDGAEKPSRVPLGPKGKAGIGLLVAGGVGVITGGIIYAQQRKFDDDSAAREDWAGRNFRPPGVGVMVAGGAIAVTGVVLLIVDRVQARRQGDEARQGVLLVPTTNGLAFTGRF